MRSGSSLLTQIVSGHPEILGSGELFINYRTPWDAIPWDLRAMDGKNLVRARGAGHGAAKIVVDKLLHDWQLTDAALDEMRSHDVTFVFLVRRPEPAIKSCIESLSYTEEDAHQYYVERLGALAKYARHPAVSGSIALTFEELVVETADTLERLSQAIGLEKPLDQNYETTTHKRFAGDPSTRFDSGVIQSDRATNRDGPPLDPVLLEASERVYTDTLETFEQHLSFGAGAG